MPEGAVGPIIIDTGRMSHVVYTTLIAII